MILDPTTKFEIEYECDRFCEDLKVMTLVTDALFTGAWQTARKYPEPDGVRIASGGRVVPTTR